MYKPVIFHMFWHFVEGMTIFKGSNKLLGLSGWAPVGFWFSVKISNSKKPNILIIYWTNISSNSNFPLIHSYNSIVRPGRSTAYTFDFWDWDHTGCLIEIFLKKNQTRLFNRDSTFTCSRPDIWASMYCTCNRGFLKDRLYFTIRFNKS